MGPNDPTTYLTWLRDETTGDSFLPRPEWDEALVHPRLAIVGPPGSGKTAYLRHLANVWSRGLLDAPSHASLLFPIFLQASEYMPESLVPFREKLESGNCLLLLDDFSASLLEQVVNAYPKCRYVVSARQKLAGFHCAPADTIAILIPAYQPGESLMKVLRALAGHPIVVVDDGSGEAWEPLFSRAAQIPGVRLLRHGANQGKGAALKTGMQFALAEFPGLTGIVTADADGQHDPKDIERVAARLAAEPQCLVLGARHFDGAVPLRSRFGNIVTRQVVKWLAGQNLTDTQTGLRGIPARLLPHLQAIPANGYEFELEMLLAARRLEARIVEESIRTIYEPGHRSSHFNPLLDSMKIYFVLLRFSSVSLVTALLDNLVFIVAYHQTGRVLESQVIGRLAGVAFNYWMVRRAVFDSHRRHGSTLPRYLALALVSGTASYGGIEWLAPAMGVYAAKIFMETALFFVNFTVQRLYIFGEKGRPGGLPYAFALAAVVGLEIYGLATGRLFAQEIWTPNGLAGWLRYTGIYIAAATPILILAPWGFAIVVAAVAAVASGPAILAPAFFLLSAESLGLGLLTGVAVYIVPMPFLARLPINYWWFYAGVLAIPVVWKRRMPKWPELELRTWSERAAFALLVYVLSLHWLMALKPETSADALSMHLAIPANIAANHRMTYEPSRFLWAVMPMGADFAYSIVYVLGGEFAARLLNFAMLLVIEGLLYRVIRRWLSRPAAFVLLALFAATPMVQLVTGSLFVENLLAALLLGAITGAEPLLYGAAIATKFGAVAFAAAGLPFTLWKARRRWWQAALIVLACAAPPYLVAWWKTGNPLYPFLDSRIPLQDVRFRQPLRLTTLYDLTFHTSRWYEGQDGSFGFQYLLLVPLALLVLLLSPGKRVVAAAVVSMGASVLILWSEPNARYLYPALPMLTIPFAFLLSWLEKNQRWLYRAMLAFVLASIALDMYFLPASSYYHKEFFGSRELPAFRQVVAYFEKAHPRTNVLLTEDSFAAGLTGEVYENHWHQAGTMQQIRAAGDLDGLRRLLQQWKVEYFIARRPVPHQPLRPPVLRELISLCTQSQFEAGGYYVAHLEPQCRSEKPPPLSVARQGSYDDFDDAVRFHGDWQQSREFEEPFRHTISFSEEAGDWTEFTFEGTAVTYVFTRAPNRGAAEIIMDGKSLGTVDLYSPTIHWQTRQEYQGLSPGRHTIEVRVAGQKTAASQGIFVDVDAFEVR